MSELEPGVTPGMVCAHHHIYSALARGMPAPPMTPRTFRQILEQVWWRLDTALDLEMLEWSAKLAALEALESGTTAIVDHHESPERHRGIALRDRRRVRGGRRARRVRLRRHGPPRPGRRRARAGGEPAVPLGRRPRARRDPCRVHLQRRHAGGGRGARTGARRGRARARLRGARGCRRAGQARAPRDAGLAPRPRRPPADRPRARRHDPPQPVLEPQQLGRVRQPGPLRQPRRARDGWDRGADDRDVPARLRAAALRGRDGIARTRRGAGSRRAGTWFPRRATTA